MNLDRLLPVNALRPRWTSASFLFYAGALVVLFAGLGLIAALTAKAGNHDAAAVGWSALLLAAAAAAAALLHRHGRLLLAGLAAFVGVAFVTAFAAALVNWVGLAPESAGLFQRSFEPGVYLVALATIAAALAALYFLRFPFLVLPLASTLLYLFVDLGTWIFGDGGTTVRAVFALLGGAVLVAAGVALDRSGRAPYAFWLHLVGGFAFGAGLLELTTDSDAGWFVVAAGCVVYVVVARVLGRSSYAVLAAIGVMIVSSHWIGSSWIGGLVPFFGFGGGEPPEPWQVALAYVAVGLVLVLLGALAQPGAFGRDAAAQEGVRDE